MIAERVYDRRIGMVGTRLEHLERIESYGLKRVELVILDRREEQAVRRFLQRTGATLSVHCPLFRDCGVGGHPLLAALFDTNAERQERSLRLMETELTQAAEWAATHLVVHLQRPVEMLGESVPPGWDEARVLDAALKVGERLAAAAECADVPVHIENMVSQPLFARPEAYLSLFEGLASPWMSMCLDVGHAALDAAKYGFDLLEFAALVAPHVGSLHLYNNQIAEEFDFATLRDQGRLKKHPLHPDDSTEEGWIDVAGVLDAVLPRKPDALITLEVYFALDTSREEFRSGLEWLEQRCAAHWASRPAS